MIAKTGGTYYIESISLYRMLLIKDENGEIKWIKPGEEGFDYYIGSTKIMYKYFRKFGTDYSNIENINYSLQTETLSYKEYEPIYNTGAEKARTINIKESNYFNILQTLAESFDAWLDLKILRREDGSVYKKIASFKNYIGQENPVGLKYGVNL